jgi:hypothetical protein
MLRMKSVLKEMTTYKTKQNYKAADIIITVSIASASITIQAYTAKILYHSYALSLNVSALFHNLLKTHIFCKFLNLIRNFKKTYIVYLAQPQKFNNSVRNSHNFIPFFSSSS